MPLAVQGALLAVFVAAFALYPSARRLRRFETWISALARRKELSVALTGLITLSICGVVALRVGIHLPAAQDGDSYLLAGDTFAHGRLTNPAHPLWQHFETYHVIFRPTYQSKYPPAQGLFLALGQVLTGSPIAGVWISLSLAMSALVWMLQAWISPRWALMGALLALCNGWIFIEWGFTYWGGAVAMLGGALFLGGLARWLQRPSAYTGLIAAIGVSLLANSRPYEGLVFVIASILVFGMPKIARLKVGLLWSVWPKVLPAAAALAVNFFWMGYYNDRVTGNPLIMPYQVWTSQYLGSGVLSSTVRTSAPAFNESLARMALPSGGAPLPMRTDNIDDPADRIRKVKRFGTFYLGLFLGFPVAAALLLAGRRIWGAALAAAAVTLAVVFENTQGHPHYLAPATCVIVLLAAKGLQRISIARFFGVLDGRCVVLALLAASAVSLGLFALRWQETRWSDEKERVLDQLKADGRRHVVIVQYRPGHIYSDEWVYNGADIDASQVIWARDLGAERNKELIQYYPDRTIWELDADLRPATLAGIRKPQ